MERKTAKEILNFYWGKEHTNYTVIDAMHEFARQEIALAKEAWEKEKQQYGMEQYKIGYRLGLQEGDTREDPNKR